MQTINVMPIEEVIARVSEICKECNVKHLYLFDSFAKGTNLPRSDIDFIVYGCEDMMNLSEKIDDIPTLRKIDLFDYDEVCSNYLREDMDKYGIQIF